MNYHECNIVGWDGQQVIEKLQELQKFGVDLTSVEVNVSYDGDVTLDWEVEETPEEEMRRIAAEKIRAATSAQRRVEIAERELERAKQALADYQAGKPRKMPF